MLNAKQILISGVYLVGSAVVCSLSACGQTGALYLPPAANRAASPAPITPPTASPAAAPTTPASTTSSRTSP